MFFKVSNLKQGQAYKFNVMNLVKPDSLHNQGLKILCRSINADACWKRKGTNIAYYKNSILRYPNAYYYTLTFTLTADTEAMYVASDHPYSYTDLCNFIKEVCTEESKSVITKAILCKTIAGNECPILTVTNFNSSKEEIDKREVIIFTARIHPGYIFT